MANNFVYIYDADIDTTVYSYGSSRYGYRLRMSSNTATTGTIYCVDTDLCYYFKIPVGKELIIRSNYYSFTANVFLFGSNTIGENATAYKITPIETGQDENGYYAKFISNYPYLMMVSQSALATYYHPFIEGTYFNYELLGDGYWHKINHKATGSRPNYSGLKKKTASAWSYVANLYKFNGSTWNS